MGIVFVKTSEMFVSDGVFQRNHETMSERTGLFKRENYHFFNERKKTKDFIEETNTLNKQIVKNKRSHL